MEAKDRIIVALDVSSFAAAENLIRELAPHVGLFKVGLQLLTAVGAPKVVEFVHRFGGNTFLDGKFDDIPNTVAEATAAASAMRVNMLNVHASAGIPAMMAAVLNKGNSKVLAVTVLTSLGESQVLSIFGAPSKEKVLQLAWDAKIAGVDGIICSPQELVFLRQRSEFKDLLFVTPGIRSKEDPPDDQKRTMSPGEAILAGAHYLVIGRPITKQKYPADAAKRIAEEMQNALERK
jgi:orotidine-5'-phosphate decarboxylase